MEGSDGTCEGSKDTTTLVRIEELKCAIRKLPYVTVLAPVRAVGDKGPGWQVSLSCSRCQEYGSCRKKAARASSPPLACAPNGARMLAGAAEATALSFATRIGTWSTQT